MSHSERGVIEEAIVKGLVKYGKYLIIIVETVIIASVSALIALTTYYLVRDIMIVAKGAATIVELQLIMNDIFLLIVYVELVRSIVVAYRRPEMYLVSIAEVGFVISVREILASVVAKTTFDLLMASVSSAVLALVLWILYKKVLPHKRPTKKPEAMKNK
ncbi:MAG: hypothetical protein B6U85_02615 [Desulfurococcales archaeon ex4484_42]|nr:MAG: hypothetical protein B6U85_02615 [Desulfurococcales archaeon ex4484_42]